MKTRIFLLNRSQIPKRLIPDSSLPVGAYFGSKGMTLGSGLRWDSIVV